MTRILAAALAAALAVPAAAAPADDVVAAVRQLDRLIVKKDAEGLRALLLPDFVGAVPTGRSFRLEEYVAFHCRPGEGLTSIEPAPDGAPLVRVFDGRYAVVNRRVDVRRRFPDGRETPARVQRIEVLVHADGRWRLASGQGTQVQPPAEAPPAAAQPGR